MILYDIRILLDAALVVLIWITQVIIYPGFRAVDTGKFKPWHQQYTVRMSAIVLPLISGQLGIVIFQAATRPDWYSVSSLFLVAIACFSTFLTFMPMHRYLTTKGFDLLTINRMVVQNWFRTIAWSLVLVLDLVFMT